MARLEASLADEQARRIARHEKELGTRAKELGVEIVSRAIQRYAAEHTAETTITRVPLADEDLKGRIIGKEGRNIKSFEQATGVDLLIDPTGESEHPPRLHRVLLERLVQKSQRAALPRELPNCEISVDAALLSRTAVKAAASLSVMALPSAVTPPRKLLPACPSVMA